MEELLSVRNVLVKAIAYITALSLLAACSAFVPSAPPTLSNPVSVPTSMSLPSATVIPTAAPSSTATAIPTNTSLPPATPAGTRTALPLSAPTIIAALGKEWNYVVLGDSSSWGFPKFYAQRMEQDLGIKVRIVDRTIGGLSSGTLLKLIRSDDSFKRDLSRAQVITVYANAGDQIGSAFVGRGTFDCSGEAVARYQSDVDAILAEILSFRAGQPTIIRTFYAYVPIYAQWKEWGKYEEYKRCWETLNRAVEEVAVERQVLFARVYEALNGPTHDEDPAAKGYFYDWAHTNELGSQVMAEAFWKLGYGYLVP